MALASLPQTWALSPNSEAFARASASSTVSNFSRLAIGPNASRAGRGVVVLDVGEHGRLVERAVLEGFPRGRGAAGKAESHRRRPRHDTSASTCSRWRLLIRVLIWDAASVGSPTRIPLANSATRAQTSS